MNDIFYFIETWDLTNYTYDNNLHHIASTIETVLSALRTDTKAGIDWFINNCMQANSSKSQFMFLKHLRCNEDVADPIEIDSIIYYMSKRHQTFGNENRWQTQV